VLHPKYSSDVAVDFKFDSELFDAHGERCTTESRNNASETAPILPWHQNERTKARDRLRLDVYTWMHPR